MTPTQSFPCVRHHLNTLQICTNLVKFPTDPYSHQHWSSEQILAQKCVRAAYCFHFRDRAWAPEIMFGKDKWNFVKFSWNPEFANNFFSLWKIISFRCGYYIKCMPILDHSGTNYQSFKIAQAHHLFSLSLRAHLLIFLFSSTCPLQTEGERNKKNYICQAQFPVTRSAKDQVSEELKTNRMPCQGCSAPALSVLPWTSGCFLQDLATSNP